jgi:hypothetical protein
MQHDECMTSYMDRKGFKKEVPVTQDWLCEAAMMLRQHAG